MNINFETMPHIMTYFPLIFENKAQWTGITIKCNDCRKDIPHKNTRGYVDKQFFSTYRDNGSMSYNVMAYGLCNGCNIITKAAYSLCDDMTISYFDHEFGKHKTWKAKKITPINRCTNWFKSLFYK